MKKFYNIDPLGQCYKLLKSVIYEFFNKLVFVPGKLFKPSLTNTLAYYKNPLSMVKKFYNIDPWC